MMRGISSGGEEGEGVGMYDTRLRHVIYNFFVYKSFYSVVLDCVVAQHFILSYD